MSQLANTVDKTTIYLSGPISLDGKATSEQIYKFMGIFAFHANSLRTIGFNIIDPCDLDKQNCWEDYMKLNLQSVCKSDLVAVLPRWQESRGARLEVFIARELGIPVEEVDSLYPTEALNEIGDVQ